jgi:hypothetical protein
VPRPALWGLEKLDWLRRFLPFRNGIASHDTFSRMFALLDAEEFEACFIKWMERLCPSLRGHAIHIDGKSLRGSHNGIEAMAHLVSAWDSKVGVTLGQFKTADKSNEIIAVPQLVCAKVRCRPNARTHVIVQFPTAGSTANPIELTDRRKHADGSLELGRSTVVHRQADDDLTHPAHPREIDTEDADQQVRDRIAVFDRKCNQAIESGTLYRPAHPLTGRRRPQRSGMGPLEQRGAAGVHSARTRKPRPARNAPMQGGSDRP